MTDDVSDEELTEAIDAFVAAIKKQAADFEWGNTAAGSAGNPGGPPGGMPGAPPPRPHGTDPGYRALLDDIDEVRGYFDKFFDPQPADFDALIDRMTTIEENLGVSEDVGGDTRLESIDTAKNAVQHWHGRFATNLAEHYLAPLEQIRVNHGRVAACLRGNAEALREVYANGRRNAVQTARNGAVAAEAVTVSKGADLAVFYQVALGLVPFVTPMLPATIGVQLATAAITTGLSAAKTTLPEETEVPLGADTLEGVLDNVRTALDRAWKIRRDDEDRARDAIRDSEATVREQLSKPGSTKAPMVPDRPDIVGADHPSEGLEMP